jgi:ABC-type dipeptide/oligopeptide/nickel transport system permease subunit
MQKPSELLPSRSNRLRQALSRLKRSPEALVSIAVLSLFLLAAVFAEQIAPHDPQELGWGTDNLPPAWVQTGLKPGSPEHLLGTDKVGRDILSRLIYGTRTAMFVALIAAPLAAVLGALVGILAGFYGGSVEQGLMRTTDLFGAYPAIMFSVLLVLLLRDTVVGNWAGGLLTLILAFALIGWVSVARLVRGAVLILREEPFIEAARSVGVQNHRILWRHLLPNITSLVLVWLTTAIPRVIILEALLGYIGLRITATAEAMAFYVTSWGGMFFDGRGALRSNPVLLIGPSVCVILVVVSFTILGDTLRDWLDPRLQKE